MKSRFYLSRDVFLKTVVPASAITVKAKDTTAIAYIWEKNDRPYAACFGGKRAKPDSYFWYTSEASRAKAVSDHFAAVKRGEEYRAKDKAERKASTHTLEVGQVLSSSWGYDQTNVDFYEVVEVVSDKMVKIRGIVGSIDESDDTYGRGSVTKKANPREYGGHLGDKPYLKRAGAGNSVKVRSFASASPSSGSERQTHWAFGH